MPPHPSQLGCYAQNNIMSTLKTKLWCLFLEGPPQRETAMVFRLASLYHPPKTGCPQKKRHIGRRPSHAAGSRLHSARPMRLIELSHCTVSTSPQLWAQRDSRARILEFVRLMGLGPPKMAGFLQWFQSASLVWLHCFLLVTLSLPVVSFD